MIIQSKQRGRDGIMLVDLMFYISLLAVILILTAVVFNQFSIQSGKLRRNIDDIERAMKAGERWRSDLHAATGPIRKETLDGAETMIRKPAAKSFTPSRTSSAGALPVPKFGNPP
jgi:hypothetical protein